MKRRIHAFIVIALIAVFGVTVWVIWRWANSPVEQTVTQQTPIKSSVPTPQTATLPSIALNESKFSTKLPGGFTIRSREQTPNGRVRILAHAPVGNGAQVSVTYAPLPVEGMSGVSDYTLRASSSSDYQAYTDLSLPAGAQAYKRITDNQEITVFWKHSTYYMSVTASGSNIQANTFEGMLSVVLDNWQWK